MIGENKFTGVTIEKLINRVAIKSKRDGFYGYSSSSALNIYKATNKQNWGENIITYLN